MLRLEKKSIKHLEYILPLLLAIMSYYFQDQKRSLQEKYNGVQEEETADMVQKEELAIFTKQHKLSWQLINNLKGRKMQRKVSSKEITNKTVSANGMFTLRTYLERSQLSPIQMKKLEPFSIT